MLKTFPDQLGYRAFDFQSPRRQLFFPVFLIPAYHCPYLAEVDQVIPCHDCLVLPFALTLPYDLYLLFYPYLCIWHYVRGQQCVCSFAFLAFQPLDL